MLYDIVRDAASEKNISFHKLEGDCHLANGTIAKWKTGKGLPRWDAVIRVAVKLGIPFSVLKKEAGA